MSPELLFENGWLLFLTLVWVLPWKGLSLWRAARLGDKWWFVILLIVNTMGVLEILYIYLISKRKSLGKRLKKA